MRRHKGLSFYKRRRKVNTAVLRETASYAAGMAVAVFLAFCMVYFAGMKIGVVGVSMEPELYNGQSVLVNRFVYKLIAPKRGDIVVFLPNGNHNSHYYVKRVVGVPGDTVHIMEGILYVNKEAVSDDTYDLIADAGIAENELKLKDGEYFVMGDNCNSSEDSRSANIGAVLRDNIVGKAWFRFGDRNKKSGLIK